MLTKNQILNNLREYNAEQLAEAINSGVITLYELSKSGNLTPLMHKRILAKLEESGTSNVAAEDCGDSIPVANISVKQSVPIMINQSDNDFDVPSNIVLSDDCYVPVTTSMNMEETSSVQRVKSNKDMLKRSFSFHGRICRTEYCLSYLLYIIWYGFYMTTIEYIENIAIIIYLASIIPAMWFILAQGAKRCHDRGNSGWYQVIPFYGLWMVFAGSEPAENKYGDCPK